MVFRDWLAHLTGNRLSSIGSNEREFGQSIESSMVGLNNGSCIGIGGDIGHRYGRSIEKWLESVIVVNQ
jgi:hypothetical protein